MPTAAIIARLLLAAAAAWLAAGAAAQCLADVNADGQADSTDFFAWVQAFGAGDIVADVNQDGQISSADFFAWVSAFPQPCPAVSITELWTASSGPPRNEIPASFSRDAVARQPDGTDVGPGEPRYGEETLSVSTPIIRETFTNVLRSSLHIGAGYASDDTLVQFNILREGNLGGATIQATHGINVVGDPLGGVPANARRYNWQTRSNPQPGDLFGGVENNDTFTVNAGAYFQDAWVVASSIRREGTGPVSGVAIAVGNYTPSEGLSGPGGQGTQLETVFTDIEARTTNKERLREWSVLVFVIDDNKAVFNIVDYSAESDNNSWAIMILASREARGEPWSYGRPCVVFSKTDSNRVDHFHHMGSAVQSESGQTPGALTQITSAGDVFDDQAVYLRTIHEPGRYDECYTTHTYGGTGMEIAFASPPAPGTFFTRLYRFGNILGTSQWGDERTIFGLRNDDTPARVSDWGAPQFVGCAPGPKRSQILLGGDRTRSHAIFCYDIDTFDPETESPYPQVWQRWGNTSQFGAFMGNQLSGLMTFRIHTPTPEAPVWYAADISHTNQGGDRTPNSIMIGRATSDGRVLFGKIAQGLSTQSFAMTRDGTRIFTGGTEAAWEIRLQRAPRIVRPRLLGAGFDQYQPLYAPDTSPLSLGVDAGPNQVLNQFFFDTENRNAITSGFATDAQLGSLENAGLALPGLGPVYTINYTNDAPEGIYISGIDRRTLPVRAEFSRLGAPSVQGAFPERAGRAELLFAVVAEPDLTPRSIPLRFSIGHIPSGNPTIPGNNYGNVVVESGQWFIGRIPWSSDAIGSIWMYLGKTNTVENGQVPVRFLLQIIGLAILPPTGYPMGYHGMPHTASTTLDSDFIVGATPLPDEQQSLEGPGTAGTVVYHLITDPAGVDLEYYQEIRDRGETADHALVSLQDDDGRFLEIGWRNGDRLYVRATPGNGTPETRLLSGPFALQRQDDFKIVVRYAPEQTRVDVWQNGRRVSDLGTTPVPGFTEPTIQLGSAERIQTLPVMALSVATTPGVLSDAELRHALRTGGMLTSTP